MKKAATTTKYYSYYYRQGDILLERIYEIPKQIIKSSSSAATAANSR